MPKAFLLTNEILSDQLYEQANRYRVLSQAEWIDSVGKIPGPIRTPLRNIPEISQNTKKKA